VIAVGAVADDLFMIATARRVANLSGKDVPCIQVPFRSENNQMKQATASQALALISRPSLLLTESAEEFEALQAEMVQAIEPCGIIEQIFVSDMVKLVWEIVRLRRCKVTMINTAYCPALEKLLEQMSENRTLLQYEKMKALAANWFTEAAVKQKVTEILGRFQLDESAIEAEAIRSLAPQLEMLDRMLAALEVRRNRALQAVADYRASFARTVRERSNDIIEAESFRRLSDDRVA
jgi:hypothetical protein